MVLWLLLITKTDKYAEYSRLLSAALKLSEIENWIPVIMLEIKTFTVVLLEMGIIKRSDIHLYRTKNLRNIPWWQKMFSRKLKLNFEIFSLNSLCFPSGQEKYDPCAKFVRHANRNFKLHYAPYQELSIDESLIGTLCHFSITQYLPNKKHHWWVKFWMLCNAVSKYCLIFHSYKGAEVKTDSDGKKFELGYNVVVNLLKENYYLNKEYHIFANNFF